MRTTSKESICIRLLSRILGRAMIFYLVILVLLYLTSRNLRSKNKLAFEILQEIDGYFQSNPTLRFVTSGARMNCDETPLKESDLLR